MPGSEDLLGATFTGPAEPALPSPSLSCGHAGAHPPEVPCSGQVSQPWNSSPDLGSTLPAPHPPGPLWGSSQCPQLGRPEKTLSTVLRPGTAP